MSSAVQNPVKVDYHHNNKVTNRKDGGSNRRNTSHSSTSQKKHKYDKNGRKRSKSFSGCGNGKFNPPYKCRPVLPTKFLLGGNITDPLNLNSLQDEEINRAMNAVTPKSSPIPTPPRRKNRLEVIIPPNINDPLNLIDCADDAEYEQQLCSPIKKGKRRKKRKRTSSGITDVSDADVSGASEAKTPEVVNDSAKIPDEPPKPAAEGKAANLSLELSPKKEKHKRKLVEDGDETGKKHTKKFKFSMDKIVSPVIPQPGTWQRRPSNRNMHRPNRHQNNKQEDKKMPKFHPKNENYQYGNYNRYYGYRNPLKDIDVRLKCFSVHRDLFVDKDILDIGCNIGHITLCVARDFGAKSVIGIDIDPKLISIARKNIRHYVNCSDSPRDDDESSAVKHSDKCFPISMPIVYGPVDVPLTAKENPKKKGVGFPNNVTFVQGNYVLENDALLSTEQPQFDVILCLSITKWLHLNWGDAGLKQAFRRMYLQLRPGGKLILEPQSWVSYKHKKNLTERIYKNYQSIEFFPDKFTQYLLSSEVGFAKSEVLAYPHHPSKGFQRPIQVYTKNVSSTRTMTPATPAYKTPATLMDSTTSSNPSKNNVYTDIASFCDNEPYQANFAFENSENENCDSERKTLVESEKNDIATTVTDIPKFSVQQEPASSEQDKT